jgi:hypothetical protein
MAGFRHFWRFVRNAPRGASGVFLIYNTLLNMKTFFAIPQKRAGRAGGGLFRYSLLVTLAGFG